MRQEIEIEYKMLLTKAEYDTIRSELPFPVQAISQTNYYFETDNFLLKQNNCALRIREKNDTYTLTLKQPNRDGILESHQTITKQEAKQLMEGHPITQNEVIKILELSNIPTDALNYYGRLTTERRQFEQNNIVYVLDKSYYNDKVDYELEIEAPTKTTGEHAFNSILQQFNITQKTTHPKIARFFATLED